MVASLLFLMANIENHVLDPLLKKPRKQLRRIPPQRPWQVLDLKPTPFVRFLSLKWCTQAILARNKAKQEAKNEPQAVDEKEANDDGKGSRVCCVTHALRGISYPDSVVFVLLFIDRNVGLHGQDRDHGQASAAKKRCVAMPNNVKFLC